MPHFVGHRKIAFTAQEQEQYRHRKQAEYDDAVSKDLQNWITPTRLKSERNWTDGAIKQFLSRHKPRVSSSKYGTKSEYRMRSILAVEAKPEFVEWMEKRVAAQKNKAER